MSAVRYRISILNPVDDYSGFAEIEVVKPQVRIVEFGLAIIGSQVCKLFAGLLSIRIRFERAFPKMRRDPGERIKTSL